MTDDRRADEAHEALDTIRAGLDQHHSGQVPVVGRVIPQWVRRLLIILSVGVLVQSVAAITLVVRDVRRDDETAEMRARNECYQRFTTNISEASAGSRRATSRGIALIMEGLEITVLTGELDSFDQAAFEQARDDLEAANTADEQAIALRNAWDAAGRPLPCPLPAGGSLTTDTDSDADE